MSSKSRFCCLAITSLLLFSDLFSGIRRSESATTTTTTETNETNSSAVPTETTLLALSTSEATTITKDDIYCGESYDCDDPFTMNSDSQLDSSSSCACRSSFMNTGKCCLSQWWIIGLAAGAGAVVLLAFAIAVGCCCSYKGKAKRAKTEAETAQQLNRKLHEDIDRLEERVKESSSDRDVAIVTVSGHSDPGVIKSAAHPSTASASAAAAAAAAIHTSSEHHVASSDTHSGVHPPHPATDHPVSTAHATAKGSTRHSEQRSNSGGQLHRQGHGGGGGGGVGAEGFHDISSHSPEPDYSRPYDNHRTPLHHTTTDSSFVDPYFGAPRKNPVYANDDDDDDDDDSLEAYDDTAPTTRNNYNYYRPTTSAYNNHHVINRPSFHY